MYLYLVFGEDPVQSERPPTSDDIENVINGDVEIYQFRDGQFVMLTPIDSEDADNWSPVEIKA